MGIYCDQADLTDYIEGLEIDDPASLEREIERAERNLDQHVFTLYPYIPGEARKLDPATLDAAEVEDLKRACCAQVEYRLEMGQEFFVRPQRDQTSRRGVNLRGKLPRIGPKVWSELMNSTLSRQTTRTGGRRDLHPRDAGWDGFD